ncbi:hypothetical protein ACET3Z_004640 [Daucus carota]
MAKLKEALGVKIDGSPNVGSQQGSCSKGVHENGDLELLTVKKKLDLNESAKEEDVENKEVGEENNVGGKNEVKENDDAQFKSSGEEKGVETIVVEDNGGEVPLENEVEQAVGTFIAWPRNLLREVKANGDRVKSGAVKGSKKNGAKKMKKMNELVSEPAEQVVNMGPDFPPALKRLWLWARDALKDGRSQPFKLSQEAFGSTDKRCLFKSDISALCFGGEISGSVISMFINGIKIYKEDAKKFLKKKINWENLAGVPAQTGTTDCGLFVMLYMREICVDKELKFASKWARRTNLVFDNDDLNEIRSAWAKYFMRQHAT